VLLGGADGQIAVSDPFMKKPLLDALGFVLLALSYTVLFSVGGAHLGPSLPDPGGEGDAGVTMLAILAVAIIDTALLRALATRSRVSGWPLAVMLGVFLYGVKTFSSTLEAAYFMRNVRTDMLPGLFGMTVPLCVLLPPLLVLVVGRWKRTTSISGAWAASGLGWPATVGRIALLSCVVYPALFLLAGWFIAFRSPEVRAFYGGTLGSSFIEHTLSVVSRDPLFLLFESARGLLWVLLALPVLRLLDAPKGVATALVALAFALIQNDVHLLPNPLMPPVVQRYHFVETASSNAVLALAIGWLLGGTTPDRR
jgi:hypothetical protein